MMNAMEWNGMDSERWIEIELENKDEWIELIYSIVAHYCCCCRVLHSTFPFVVVVDTCLTIVEFFSHVLLVYGLADSNGLQFCK